MNRNRKLSFAAAALALTSLLPSAASNATVTGGVARMTLNPATKTVVKGTSFALVVKVNTMDRPVNSIQFYITLPSARLNCSRIAVIADAWPNVAATSCNSTTAAFAAYSEPGTSFTGIARVARITLKATQMTGNATVSFSKDRTMVADAETNADILGSMNRAVVTVTK